MEKLLKGELNTFVCQGCQKLGFAEELITIFLYEGHVIFFKPVDPKEEPSMEEYPQGVIFLEPLGKPLKLLDQYIKEYEEQWKKRYGRDPKKRQPRSFEESIYT